MWNGAAVWVTNREHSEGVGGLRQEEEVSVKSEEIDIKVNKKKCFIFFFLFITAYGNPYTTVASLVSVATEGWD